MNMLRRRMMMGQSESIDYSQQYFTIEAHGSGTIQWYKSLNSIQYSLNDGSTWQILQNDGSINVSANTKVLWKGSNMQGPNDTYYCGIGQFLLTDGPFSASGNIMSLIYGDNFANQTNLLMSKQFKRLFQYNTALTDISKLVMPATYLTESCYFCMFQECGIVTAPRLLLPATTLSSSAYSYMFAESYSLTNAPDLPASSLTYQSYIGMFRNTSVNYVKCLATSWNNTDGGSTYVWMQNVPSTGTFVKARMASWSTGQSGIPSGWTVQNAT